MFDPAFLAYAPSLFAALAFVFGLLIGSFLNVVIFRLPIMMEREFHHACRMEYADEFKAMPQGPEADRAETRSSSGVAGQAAGSTQGQAEGDGGSAAPTTGQPKGAGHGASQSEGQNEPQPASQSERHGERQSGMHYEPEPPFNLWRPRSACPQCSRAIRWYENIPLISYALLAGRCRGCRARIPLRYPLVELVAGLLAAWLALTFGPTPAFLGMLIFSWALLALTAIDLDHQLLPDSITLPVLWLGLLFNLNGTFTDLHSAVLGAVFGYLSLFTVYWLFKLTTGKEGMGFGDFKLLAMIGAWGGWPVLLPTVLLSSLVGAVVGITLIASGRMNREKPIPFGPYLATAGLLALVWGDALTGLWLGG